MGRCCVAQFVDGLHGRVHRRVITDRVIRAGDVVVDRAGDAYDWDAFAGQITRALESSIATDCNNGIEVEHLGHFDRPVNSLRGLESLGPGRHQEGSSPLKLFRDRRPVQFLNITAPETMVAAPDAIDPVAIKKAGAGDSTDGCIHAWGITATGQNADVPDNLLFIHRFCISLIDRLQQADRTTSGTDTLL